MPTVHLLYFVWSEAALEVQLATLQLGTDKWSYKLIVVY